MPAAGRASGSAFYICQWSHSVSSSCLPALEGLPDAGSALAERGVWEFVQRELVAFPRVGETKGCFSFSPCQMKLLVALRRDWVAYPESHQFEEEGGGGGRGGDENRRRGNFPRGPWEGWGVVLLLLS